MSQRRGISTAKVTRVLESKPVSQSRAFQFLANFLISDSAHHHHASYDTVNQWDDLRAMAEAMAETDSERSRIDDITKSRHGSPRRHQPSAGGGGNVVFPDSDNENGGDDNDTTIKKIKAEEGSAADNSGQSLSPGVPQTTANPSRTENDHLPSTNSKKDIKKEGKLRKDKKEAKKAKKREAKKQRKETRNKIKLEES